MKTAELIGKSLNFAVARALGKRPHIIVYPITKIAYLAEEHQYSEDWSQGGPIIEREKIELKVPEVSELGPWMALQADASGDYIHRSGSTPLIAAMRCFIASKLGDEVDIPEELK